MFSKKPIYSLFKEKLDSLREYLKQNQKNKFIWELIYPAEYPIIFMLKKDRILWLYINY